MMSTATMDKPKILVVEDDPTLREVLANYLAGLDYNVLRAASGNKALELLKTDSVHLIISDIRMPDGDGFALLKQLGKNPKGRPEIILMSGYSDYSAQDCLAQGARSILAKPFDLNALKKEIREALEEARKKAH